MPSHVDFSALTGTLRTVRLGVGASDLHGSLSGYLCAGAKADAAGWIGALQLGFDTPDAAGNPVLQDLFHECSAQFPDDATEVEPLLPPPSASLPQRADALVEWCRGFLGGFGLGGSTQRGELSAQAKDILGDLATIAASRFDYEGGEADEESLAEVLDFVRLGTALLYREVSKRAQASARALH